MFTFYPQGEYVPILLALAPLPDQHWQKDLNREKKPSEWKKDMNFDLSKITKMHLQLVEVHLLWESPITPFLTQKVDVVQFQVYGIALSVYEKNQTLT